MQSVVGWEKEGKRGDQRTVETLSPSSEASRRQGGRGELLRGWDALQSALIVCHRNVSPERSGRPGQSPTGRLVPFGTGSGEAEALGSALPAERRSSGRRGGAAGGAGGGRPGPKGPARGSTLPVRPWTG
ncbi:Ewing'S Tumor-Associated Antigen 1 [Manis pentadactyla]|nr:Ewing'S Tumor-Associated Antigen 1 [Manis pentadactyla]